MWQSGFWSADFWQAGFWQGDQPVVQAPGPGSVGALGGRRRVRPGAPKKRKTPDEALLLLAPLIYRHRIRS